MAREGFFIRAEWLAALAQWVCDGEHNVPGSTKDTRARDAMTLLLRLQLHAAGEDQEDDGSMGTMDCMYDIIEPLLDDDLKELRDLGFIEED